MFLTDRERFIADFSLIAVENIPMRYVNKRKFSKSDLHIIEETKNLIRSTKGEIFFRAEAVYMLVYALSICMAEEIESIKQTGKSVRFQNYLTSKFGEITERDLSSLLRRMGTIPTS
jgi:hypothetical protein